MKVTFERNYLNLEQLMHVRLSLLHSGEFTSRELSFTHNKSSLKPTINIYLLLILTHSTLSLILTTGPDRNPEQMLPRHQPTSRLVRVVSDLVQRDQLVRERVRRALVYRLLVLETDRIVEIRPLRQLVVMMLQGVQVRRHRVDRRERRIGCRLRYAAGIVTGRGHRSGRRRQGDVAVHVGCGLTCVDHQIFDVLVPMVV